LSTSLAVTWSIGLIVRLLLPRYLGPERFGEFSFADAFAATFFVALNLGIDPYIYKTVAVRAAHASEFFGGVLLLRVGLGMLLVPPMALVLHGTDRPGAVQALVWVFSAALFFTAANNSLAAILQSQEKVRAVSVLNIAGKLTWAAGLLVAALARADLWGFVAPSLISEALKTPALWWMARRHVGLTFRIEPLVARKALLASAPFFANVVAITVFGKLDVSFLATLAPAPEVGYHGAASVLAGLTLLLSPVFGSVLFPLLSRAADRSRAEFDDLVRRALEFVVILAIPMALALALGADFWIRLVYGEAFAPAALALSIMAPTMLVTYLNMLSAYALNAMDRTWTVTLTTLAGVSTDALFNLGLLRPLMRIFDRPGGGAAACAIALLASEVAVTSAMFWLIGRRAFDRRNLNRGIKTGAAALITILVHFLAVRLGPARLLLDLCVYAALVFASGALQLGELLGFVRSLTARPLSRSLSFKNGVSK
jgi:O-antigen/teichoic acid export membrane protein